MRPPADMMGGDGIGGWGTAKTGIGEDGGMFRDAMGALLASHRDTRVSVSMAGTDGKGKVVVEFGGLEDLERIYRAMTSGDAGD